MPVVEKQVVLTLNNLIDDVHAIDDRYDIAGFKRCVAKSYEWLESAFNHCAVDELVSGRAVFVDTLLQHLWQLFELDQIDNLCLAAVGGYGRAQLQPHSDIDLLILSKRSLDRASRELVGEFITLLWDIKLDIGQSVRTVKETIGLAKTDVTVATNLVESRRLAGSQAVFDKLTKDISKNKIWTSDRFFVAKQEEQQARHAKFHGTAYNLEPNVKENPGCLRDIQTIGWVAKKHFGEYDGWSLVGHGYFTKQEHAELIECRSHLWRIRFALHITAGRSENRLLFDYQTDVAERLGYGTEGKASVESMMKAFFRTVRRVNELNQMLMQRFRHDILGEKDYGSNALTPNFELHDGLISPTRADIFRAPEDLFDFLHLIADTPAVTGLDTDCIRQVRNARRQFQDFYWHESAQCREKFMQLMRHPHFFDFAWDIMHQYGILQAYLPEWNHIVGMMQFDLFHAYTVDEHTHRLVKHVNHYFSPENKRFPRCGRIVRNLDKPELLYLAAVFHDIGKGRNGDHSVLGAADVEKFAAHHDLSKADTDIIVWLVENHLLMSVVAQRRDIYDPDVVNEFANKVKSHVHLNLLYALTLADIRATNDNLWNDWKASLLRELYLLTQKALDNGLQCQLTIFERVNENKHAARMLLADSGYAEIAIESLWSRLDHDYFARYKPAQIAWHTQEILNFKCDSADALLVKANNTTTKAGTELFIYGKDRPALFAQVASVLDSRNLSIHDANITITHDEYVCDSIIILDNDGNRIDSAQRLDKLADDIRSQISAPGRSHTNARKISRQLKQLNVPTKIRFYNRQDDATLVELEALDAPGILAKIGHAFVDTNVTLKLAKISTIGERAEDIFIVTNEAGTALSPAQQVQLKQAILNKLDQLEDIQHDA
ncbi:[protein-PII] uridylyltransferase [Alteromonas sp. ASW11-36]|uniref:Bifunctional uridylyltransferase/uridylyl-removing enzyme n=1 Tax=Alteromonas arenosi TaxID=3055817 RepID=A0ABT7SVJ3_9ALTE|nr:[protein-PII] uridylyltransferase [Alteromonas sp. ASW11-36]MDM7860217.1 [protein-PII] uridylyltransferase [Alteromonas sp. ASW11-36]